MKKSLLSSLFLLILATGCSSGYLFTNSNNNFGTETLVNLSCANFCVVRNVQTSIAVDNFHFNRSDAEKSAYAELLKEANLSGSQALINVVIEGAQYGKYFFFWPIKHGQTVSARGTVIEFLPEGVTPQSFSTATPHVDAPVMTEASTVGETALVKAEQDKESEETALAKAAQDKESEAAINRLYAEAGKDFKNNNMKAAEAKYQEAVKIMQQMNTIPDYIKERMRVWKRTLKLK